MTELIVALDGPNPYNLIVDLYDDTSVRWFKIGPQTLTCGQIDSFMAPYPAAMPDDLKFFLDLKLADTEDTCQEAVKRFAAAEIAAVSTFTDRATDAAMKGADGTPIQVWRIGRLTDAPGETHAENAQARKHMALLGSFGHGIIAAPHDLPWWSDLDIAKICPGIRWGDNFQGGGHTHPATPAEAVAAGATHIVVGRPIWQAPDPVAAAKQFLEALA